MNRWQLASGLVVVTLVCTGIGMTVAERARAEAVRESEEVANRVYVQLIPKLDEVLAELKKLPQTVQQRQEQHIHVPLDGAERERLRDQRIRDIADQLIREPNNAVQ